MTADDAALVAFLEAQHPRVLGTLVVMLQDRHLAEELAAEVMARVASRWSQIKGLEAPGPYVQRIAVNLARSTFRRAAARRRAMARSGGAEVMHHDVDLAAVIAVREAVAALPERQRACVALHHLAELSTVEVAAVLGVTPATVRSNLRDARATLRELLGDDVQITEQDDRPRVEVPHGR